MSHWDAQGNEQWVCQPGAHVCTGHSNWIEGTGNVCDNHLMSHLIRTVPVPQAKQLVQMKLENSVEWLCRAVVAIYKRQTNEEQQVQETKELNGRGFNGRDAFILSSFAKQYLAKGYLSHKQIAIARRKMIKYCGQLVAIAKQ